MKRLFLFIILSLSVHFLGGGALNWVASQFEPPTLPEQIEIAFIDDPAQIPLSPNRERTQIVRQSFVPENLKVEDQHPARFKSKERVRVAQETQAQKSGITHNSIAESLTPRMDLSKTNENKKETTKNNDNSPDGINVHKELAEYKELQGISRLSGPSTLGEALPTDIQIGSLTALNTDRYLYYSFYSRMEELVRYRWETRVRRAMELFPPQVATRYPNRSQWKTSALFVLDHQGVIRSATILSESGNRAFDLAAIDAFREAGIFPNPPQELVEEDGVIRIYFGFQVNFNPRFISGQN